MPVRDADSEEGHALSPGISPQTFLSTRPPVPPPLLLSLLRLVRFTCITRTEGFSGGSACFCFLHPFQVIYNDCEVNYLCNQKQRDEIHNASVEVSHLLDPAFRYSQSTRVPDSNSNTKGQSAPGKMSLLSTPRKVMLCRKDLCFSFGLRRKTLRFEINILEIFQSKNDSSVSDCHPPKQSSVYSQLPSQEAVSSGMGEHLSGPSVPSKHLNSVCFAGDIKTIKDACTRGTLPSFLESF